MPRWQGDPLQLAYICDALISRRDNALQRTHPTGAPTTSDPTTSDPNNDAGAPTASSPATGPPPRLN